jgi:hypothetical protein
MDAKKRDEQTTTEPSVETTKGSKRLQVSITRMKKIQSGVKGGSAGGRSWMQA